MNQSDEQPKYSPNESLTPGYSWRSSNIPKRITQARPTFVHDGAGPSRRLWPVVVIMALVIAGATVVGVKNGPQVRKALRSIEKTIR